MSNWITTNQTYGNWTSGQIHLTQEIRSPNQSVSRTPPPSPPRLQINPSENIRLLPPLPPPPLPRSSLENTRISSPLPPPPGLNPIPRHRRTNITLSQRRRIRNLSRRNFTQINNTSNRPISIKNLNDKTKLLINKELEDRCSICYLNFENDQILRKLCCDHYFHHKCIDKWFEINNKCPLCNLRLTNR